MSTDNFQLQKGILFSDNQLLRILDYSSIEYDNRANTIILMTGITTINVKATKSLFSQVKDFYINNGDR